MPKKTLSSYTVMMKGEIWLDAKIDAESLDAALDKGKTLRLSDIVDFGDTEWVDGELAIHGVYDNG